MAAAVGDRIGEVRARATRGAACFAALAATGCTRAPSAPGSLAQAVTERGPDEAFEALRTWERQARAKTDFAHASTSDETLGPDPYVIRPLAGSGSARFLGLLRGRSALVVLDGELHEIERLAAPRSPDGLAVGPQGDIFVVGELSSEVAHYRPTARGIERTGSIDLPGVRAMRDVETGPEGVVYIVEEHDGRLLTIAPPGVGASSSPTKRVETAICRGPLRVLRTGAALLVDCLVDHAIVVRTVDRNGFPESSGEVRIVHDGPMWAMDAIDIGAALTVAVGGVEDHPLDRSQGSFGFIDSFVTTYRIAGGVAAKMSEVNTSAIGVVTPKALAWSRTAAGGLRLAVAAYGSDRLATIEWDDPAARAPSSIETRAAPPGCAMMVPAGDGFVIADPLLDAWVRVRAERVDVVPVDDEAARSRSIDSRLGEALFFTTLIAPWDSSEGRLSRFACETCHFEGYVDGRTHHTGRGNVRATTKPLLGLFNNGPHFSRALDPDLATMVGNEFVVAGAKSGHDPWFSIQVRDFPWLRLLGVSGDATLGPERLRRALTTFFMQFTHRPNPSVAERTRWTDLERSGAGVFRHRCERCHQARLVADEPATRVPFEVWESLVMAPEGAIVWASSEFEKTGVVPYVSEKGARVVSLRRLYKKYPYFTNGSAKSIRAVIDGVGFLAESANAEDVRFFHQGVPEGAERLSEDEKTELAAFLDLL